MATTVLDLHEIDSIASEDLLHIIDVTRSNEDSKVDIGTLTTYLNTALSIPQTIASVNGLQAALDGKSNVGHTHSIQEIVGLSSALDLKLNSSQANIVGRIVNIKGVAITVPDEITGVRDDRIPDTVIIGEYLQFDAADGGINNISGDTLKTNLALDLVDNTSDANKPVSIATQTALDTKVDTITFNNSQNTQDNLTAFLAGEIVDNTAAIALNTAKVSFDSASSTKLAGIEQDADVTDTENVWGSLGISGSGSTEQYLTQRGVFTTQATATSVTKSAVDNAIGSGGDATDYYASDKTWKTIPTGGGGDVTKEAVDLAIGASPTGDSGKFYDEQGRFIDVVYESIEAAPIIINRTVESIVLSGTRSNVQARLTGVSEMSVITMQNTFDSSPTQYTTTFTSPNTTFTPALTFPAGSQGRQLSLTEADGTLHRFCYLVNGNYRHLAGGLTGTVRLGPVAVATTATVTAAVTVPDQTAGQTITLAGDETGTFSVGDFISPQANNFGAYRGIFVDSITFNGTNTVIVGPSNGATTFQTTSVLRNAGPATEIQGTIPTFSGDPDTANTVYSSSIPATEFTTVGVNTSAHLIQVANAYAALETAITTDGIVTDNGDGTSSITIDYNTETNIDSSFTITGGLNNMESIVNVDGAQGELAPATTITLTDPEATEVVSFTSSAATAATENVDEIAAQLVLAINNNIETPINFDAEYDQATKTIVLTAESAGNTNPWTIVFDNNGVTGENAGNLGYTSSQTGEVINQIETLSVVGDMEVGERISHHGDSDTYIRFQQSNDIINISAGGNVIYTISNTSSFIDAPSAVMRGTNSLTLQSTDASNVILQGQPTRTTFNPGRMDRDFIVTGTSATTIPLTYDAGDHTLTTDATLVGFGGGADGLSITDTVNLNLLDGTTVLSTVVLPSSGGTTIIAGTTNEIVNTVSGDTNTLSLATAITGAISDNTTAIALNTAKTGITTAQAAAITSNTGKTGITVEQSNAIIANTAKTGITTTQATAITNNTAKVSFPGLGTTSTTALAGDTRVISNTEITKLGLLTVTSAIDLDNVGQLNQDNTWVGTNTHTGTSVFSSTSTLGSIQVEGRIVHEGDTDTYINFQNDNIDTVVGGVSFHKSVLGTGGIGRITVNDGFNDIDFRINKLTTGVALNIDVGADTTTIGTDVLTINSTTINGLPSKADALSISGQVLSLLDGTTVLDTVTLPSGGTATTVQGTSGQIGVNTVGNTATVSLDTAITSAITANTAKVSVAGLNQVGAAVLSTDSVVYYAGTAQAPRRKTFSLVPLSIMNNDAGFTTNTGTVTSVTGTANQINVANGTTTPVVSLNNTITSAITANTNKTGITTAQSNAITANTSKVGITTAQANAITANTSKTGITTAQANAITANTAKITYPASASTKLGTIETNADVTDKANVDSSIGSGTLTTDYYASDKTWKTIPSGGGGDAVLANTQTFTGRNTFSDTAIFSDTDNTNGSIQVAGKIVHQGDTDTFINFTDNNIVLRVGNISGFNLDTTRLFLNPVGVDLDFIVNGNGKEAFSYDSGTDTFDVNADNITGIASAETGTWAPTFNGGGTLGTVVANYSKSGSNVICICDARLTAGTATTTPVTLNASTLPFSPEHNADGTGGTWYTAPGNAGTGGQNSGVMSIAPSGVINFLDSSTNDTLRETALRGRLQFTLTYITDE